MKYLIIFSLLIISSMVNAQLGSQTDNQFDNKDKLIKQIADKIYCDSDIKEIVISSNGESDYKSSCGITFYNCSAIKSYDTFLKNKKKIHQCDLRKLENGNYLFSTSLNKYSKTMFVKTLNKKSVESYELKVLDKDGNFSIEIIERIDKWN